MSGQDEGAGAARSTLSRCATLTCAPFAFIQLPRVQLTLSELQEMASRQQQQIEAQQQMLVAKVTHAGSLWWMDCLSVSLRLSILDAVWKKRSTARQQQLRPQKNVHVFNSRSSFIVLGNSTCGCCQGQAGDSRAIIHPPPPLK